MMETILIWFDVIVALLPASIALFVVLWIIKRNHVRVKSGWKKVEINHPLKQNVDEFSGILIMMTGGALCVEYLHLSHLHLFIPALLLITLNHWKVWLYPSLDSDDQGV